MKIWFEYNTIAGTLVEITPTVYADGKNIEVVNKG